MRRACLVAIVVTCITAPGAAGAAKGAKAAAPASRFGIAGGGIIQLLGSADRKRYFDSLETVGARWIRIDINWAVIQRKGPASYDWAPIDRLVHAARRRGIRVLGTLVFTPTWAKAAGLPAEAPPANAADFGRFARRAAIHYSAEGVHAYEIWNEPNISGFWTTGPDPARYTQLLKQAYAAIKRVDRSAVVVSAGLSPFSVYGASDANHMNPLTFLEQMYANGARGSMDAVGWHPYCFPQGLGYYSWSGWSQMAATSPSARSIMEANGDGKKKIWATEWGAPTGTSSESMSEAAQADLVRAGLTRLKAWSWAGPSFLYSLRDKGTNLSDREQNFGLVRYDWSLKPAYAAFRSVASPRR